MKMINVPLVNGLGKTKGVEEAGNKVWKGDLEKIDFGEKDLIEINDFPIKSEDYLKKRFVNFHYDKINSLQEMLEEGRKMGMTHLVIDEKESRAVYLKEIFNNEEKYPYLIKEFDSKSSGYTYHLKVFKIDYEKIIRLN